MCFYSELERMQHHGQEEIAEQINDHLKCWYCDKRLSDKELREYKNLCQKCNSFCVSQIVYGLQQKLCTECQVLNCVICSDTLDLLTTLRYKNLYFHQKCLHKMPPQIVESFSSGHLTTPEKICKMCNKDRKEDPHFPLCNTCMDRDEESRNCNFCLKELLNNPTIFCKSDKINANICYDCVDIITRQYSAKYRIKFFH